MGELSVRIVVPMAMKKLVHMVSLMYKQGAGYTYPNVVADPIIYCPSVRSIPLGPGPKRTMFVNPVAVRASLRQSGGMRTEYEANDKADGCQIVR